ncbi:MAG: SH3 domain-containing protein [Chryseobacterium sp.]|uniref:SH3 domain-containing protein n=1 Tax=Chryseobacterium sp. TaxID=1871047 RepID=UPI0025BE5669|nr:SH3 domain-containing protein [Chryseobacterium sp.]MCJ7932602.1 SH3 domain-containing protein [Chryseobacterium sp.]
MKNKARNIVFIIGTLLFSAMIYRYAKRDHALIKERYRPNVQVTSAAPVYRKANLKSPVLDTLSTGTRIKTGKQNGAFYQIIFVEDNKTVRGGYIQNVNLRKTE